MRRKHFSGLWVVSLLLVTALLPAGSADYNTKEDLSAPDEMFFDVQGQSYEEDKGEELLGGGGTFTTNVSLLRKGSSSMESSPISFPYQKFNWTIDTWYLTDDGLRFYGVFYEGEKILYDYRMPWIKLGSTRYALEKDMVADGPDLWVWNIAKVFKVWVKYHIGAENADVEVYTYFFHDGEFDPWAIVECQQKKDIQVGQRFDFDLGGASDDNAEFYLSNSTWELVEEEDDHPDAGNPEENGVQWRLFDTDQEGIGFVVDQKADIVPYHPDGSSLYLLRYHANQVSGDPSNYDNNEATGLYSSTTYDHYIGYDLVAWYVSVYGNTKWCNPGPWILVEV